MERLKNGLPFGKERSGRVMVKVYLYLICNERTLGHSDAVYSWCLDPSQVI